MTAPLRLRASSVALWAAAGIGILSLTVYAGWGSWLVLKWAFGG